MPLEANRALNLVAVDVIEFLTFFIAVSIENALVQDVPPADI